MTPMQTGRTEVGKKGVKESSRATTIRLASEYPPRTLVEFWDRDHQGRVGFVVRASAGKLVVRAPALSMRSPKRAWGVKVPYPRFYRVPPESIGEIVRRARGARA